MNGMILVPLEKVIPQWQTFRLASPWWLLALLLIPLWMWLRGRFAPVAAVQFSSGDLLVQASRQTRSARGRALLAFRYLALALLVGAMARPQVDKGLSEREAMGINIMFVLDFSGTMKTKDFSLENKRISRAEAMKKVVAEFIKARPDDRIGAVFFDAGAHLISPLTLDHDWLLAQLALEQPTRGTAPGSGMLIATEALLPAKNQTKLIITVTDADQINEGPEPDEVAKAIAPLQIKNHVIQMIDFGQSDRYTASGQILQEIARVTGGQFFKVSDYAGLRNVYRQIDLLEKSAFKENKQKAWHELMAWFVLPALFLLLLEFILGRTVWRRLP
jgi:Ca-activated chloride channel family protein